jgi:hypothetical protein
MSNRQENDPILFGFASIEGLLESKKILPKSTCEHSQNMEL